MTGVRQIGPAAHDRRSMHVLTPVGSLAELSTGTTIDRVLLVRDVDRRAKRDGSDFLRLKLADRSGVIDGVMWDPPDTLDTDVPAPMHVLGRFEDHPRYGRQVTVDELRPANEQDVDWEALLDGPERSVDALEHDLDELVSSVRDAGLRTLLERVLDPATASGRAFRRVPAAKYHHHAHPSGLLDHSLSVGQLVSGAAATLPGIDRDVAVTGALLHDIGKLEAYDVEAGCAELGDAGKLIGEIPLGYYRVRRELEALPDIAPGRAQALLHVILAHHGRLEYGSPVVPCTRGRQRSSTRWTT